MRYLYLIT